MVVLQVTIFASLFGRSACVLQRADKDSKIIVQSSPLNADSVLHRSTLVEQSLPLLLQSSTLASAGSVLWLPPRWLRIVLHLALPWSVSFMIHSRNWWAITSWLVLGGQYSAAVNEAGLLQRLMLNASAAVRRDFHYFSGGFFLHFVSC